MIRALLTPHDGSPATVVLGIDDENMRRLRDNKPIKVNLHHLDPDGPPREDMPNLNIIIAFDNADLREFLHQAKEKTSDAT